MIDDLEQRLIDDIMPSLREGVTRHQRHVKMCLDDGVHPEQVANCIMRATERAMRQVVTEHGGDPGAVNMTFNGESVSKPKLIPV